MSDAIASLSNYRQSPRKVRLVADLVRGKSAEHALALLTMLPKRAADPMAKLIKSAIANAQGEGNVSANDLFVSRIEVNAGIVFKRSMPRARGKASPIKKRTSKITLGLTRRTPSQKKPATRAPKAVKTTEVAESKE